ncbi:hypothetical protein [Rodentibacter caecimuris]|uniref:hypothetical protein n=1 Tax=Rodentibacter caecimuris TaxID=1796644 RepID=UPI0013A09528|nr:hypothetical protein [Rodentibacter heylii]QIA76139.1 hypothetical protein FEE42_01580 [Rodentibacter heylii]
MAKKVTYQLIVKVDDEEVLNRKTEFEHQMDLTAPGEKALEAIRVLEQDKLENELLGITVQAFL